MKRRDFLKSVGLMGAVFIPTNWLTLWDGPERSVGTVYRDKLGRLCKIVVAIHHIEAGRVLTFMGNDLAGYCCGELLPMNGVSDSVAEKGEPLIAVIEGPCLVQVAKKRSMWRWLFR